jgi:hypothetical protein
MDFLTVPTATLRILVLIVIGHRRREIAWFGVTSSPTAAWVVRQLREAFPFDKAPSYLLFDRAKRFSAEVVSTLRSMGVEPVRTGFRCPWQNGVAERLVATVRRELLDHVIFFNDRHLRLLLSEFVAYYHADRTHLALDKDAPSGRPVEPRPCPTAPVLAPPRAGGLIGVTPASSSVAHHPPPPTARFHFPARAAPSPRSASPAVRLWPHQLPRPARSLEASLARGGLLEARSRNGDPQRVEHATGRAAPPKARASPGGGGWSGEIIPPSLNRPPSGSGAEAGGGAARR